MKRLAILGSTGSIGQSALAVVDAHPDKLCVVALSPMMATREMAFGGNYVMLDHGNREISYFGHLQQGSVRVRKGEKVKRGEVMCLIGPSGSGKSTFLRCINHLEQVSAGRLFVVHYPDGRAEFDRLESDRVPYLEMATV